MKTGTVKCSTGIDGLDEVLMGGLPANRLYLLRGNPGVGKTTLAMQFLLEGSQRGEKSFYVTLSETKSEIEDVATSHGWDLGSLDIFELSALEEELAQNAQNTHLSSIGNRAEPNDRSDSCERLRKPTPVELCSIPCPN